MVALQRAVISYIKDQNEFTKNLIVEMGQVNLHQNLTFSRKV